MVTHWLAYVLPWALLHSVVHVYEKDGSSHQGCIAISYVLQDQLLGTSSIESRRGGHELQVEHELCGQL